MTFEIGFFGVLIVGVLAWSITENVKSNRDAKKNQVSIREGALAEIEKAGLSVDDFPKAKDALEGHRHLKPLEIIDIYYKCRVQQRNSL